MSTPVEGDAGYKPMKSALGWFWLQLILWLVLGAVIVIVFTSSATRFEDTLARVEETEKGLKGLKDFVENDLKRANKNLADLKTKSEELDKDLGNLKGELTKTDLLALVSKLQAQVATLKKGQMKIGVKSLTVCPNTHPGPCDLRFAPSKEKESKDIPLKELGVNGKLVAVWWTFDNHTLGSFDKKGEGLVFVQARSHPAKANTIYIELFGGPATQRFTLIVYYAYTEE